MHRSVLPYLPWGLILLWGLLFLTGCGPEGLEGTIPIRGRVTYQGSPVPSGEVRYLPADKTAGRVAQGALDEGGEFKLTTLRAGDGALPGTYRIVILAPDNSNENAEGVPTRAVKERVRSGGGGRRSLVPLRYTRPDQSGLQDTVDENHSGYITLELTD